VSSRPGRGGGASAGGVVSSKSSKVIAHERASPAPYDAGASAGVTRVCGYSYRLTGERRASMVVKDRP
jgi:hypothetical protein